MTHDNGGWTLMITSATNQGWTKDNVKSRYVLTCIWRCSVPRSCFKQNLVNFCFRSLLSPLFITIFSLTLSIWTDYFYYLLVRVVFGDDSQTNLLDVPICAYTFVQLLVCPPVSNLFIHLLFSSAILPTVFLSFNWRNAADPSVTKDYSALEEGDTIKSIAVSPYYLYRLEARERGTNGGIFVAPQNYRLMILFCRIKLVIV